MFPDSIVNAFIDKIAFESSIGNLPVLNYVGHSLWSVPLDSAERADLFPACVVTFKNIDFISSRGYAPTMQLEIVLSFFKKIDISSSSPQDWCALCLDGVNKIFWKELCGQGFRDAMGEFWDGAQESAESVNIVHAEPISANATREFLDEDFGFEILEYILRLQVTTKEE